MIKIKTKIKKAKTIIKRIKIEKKQILLLYKEEIMENLNQIEIQNIRHICGHAGNFCAKINYYKTLTSDTNITTVLDDITQECSSIKTELSNML